MKWIFYLLIMQLTGCSFINRENIKTKISESKPNIIFILVDDLGKEWISCYGAENIETPHIDELAKSGVIFNNFYAMPQCTPTRLSLLTGQYPFRHGWVNHWDVPRWGGGVHFDETLNPSIGLEMKKARYKTCIAGKWQIDDFRVEPDALTRNGFDEFCMWTGGEGNNMASNERYQNPYIFTQEGSKTYHEKFGPDIFKNFIIRFIRENKDTSMFIYYPMVLTHTPLVNTPDESAQTSIGKHKAMVRYTDKITGELIQVLNEEGIRENTLVIFTTDNGTAQGIKGVRNGTSVNGGKALTSENGVNLPFIANWPLVLKPGISDALIDITDLFPTFSDIAGIEIDADFSGYNLDGKSFKKVLVENKPESERNFILAMGGQNNARLTEKGVENQYEFRDRVIRNKKYKLWINSNRKPVKFYDLTADPLEKTNLLDSLTNAERKTNFDKLFDIILSQPEKDNDPVYRANPPQPWDVQISAKSGEWKIR